MKLFISYSRDDRAWVYEFSRALRDRADHDVWIDQRIALAQDWWLTILQNIQAAQAFVYVMTPQAIQSIYCRAEMLYALALNKPILPIILKSCDYPQELRDKRVHHYEVKDTDNLDNILLKTEKGLGRIEIALVQGEFQQSHSHITYPPEPKPEPKIEQVVEVFHTAEEASDFDNFSLSEKLFQQVIEADPLLWGRAAEARLRGMITRKLFVEALKAAVSNAPVSLYAEATDVLYRGLWERTAVELRRDLNLNQRQNPRDAFRKFGLIYTELAEMIATNKLDKLEIVTMAMAMDIVWEVTRLIHTQAQATAHALGMDLVTEKRLLSGGE